MELILGIILWIILIIIIILILILWKGVLTNLRIYEKNLKNIEAYNIYRKKLKQVIVLGALFIFFSFLLILVSIIIKI